MASKLKQLHQDILDALSSIVDEDNKPRFKYINIWNNQIDDIIQLEDNKNYSFRMPAVFCEIDFGLSSMLGAGVISFPSTVIRFHILHQLLDARNGKMERNLDVIDYRDFIVSKFNGIGIPSTSSFQHFEEMLDYKHGSVYKYVVGFTTNVIDTTGSRFDENDGREYFELDDPTITLRRPPRIYQNSPLLPLYISPSGKYYIYTDSANYGTNY